MTNTEKGKCCIYCDGDFGACIKFSCDCHLPPDKAVGEDRCGKSMPDGSICGVIKDCHLHDWRQKDALKAYKEQLRAKVEGMIEKEPDSCACQGVNYCIWHVGIAPQNAAYRTVLALLDDSQNDV